MTVNFYEDPKYFGKPILIPVDRLPKNVLAKKKNSEFRMTIWTELIEIEGELFLKVKRWKGE